MTVTRQKQKRKLVARYEITTPMFIGDARQHASGIPAGAVKGALRFWWRALNWGRVLQDSGGQARAALRQLHDEEGELFGSAADNGPGQGRFLLRVDLPSTRKAHWDNPGYGLQYLMGLGIWRVRDRTVTREALAPGEVTVTCRLRPDLDDERLGQLCDALLALGTLGGLGSRSRKGFGSMAIQSLELDGGELPTVINAVPADAKAQTKLVKRWAQPVDLPPFTAFSRETRLDLSLAAKGAAEPLDLLDAAGREMQLYRSWGRQGRVCGREAEQNFRPDHDLLRQVAGGTTPTTLPERAVFGLPHNYFFSSDNAKVDVSAAGEGRSRRASPLFIHVHRFPDGQAALLHLLLPARFLPDGEPVQFKPGRRPTRNVPFQDALIDWGTIHTYLDRFDGRERLL